MIKNLKLLRNQHKISQQKLAEIVGVSQQAINKYENHDIEPDIKTLILLAKHFNTSIDYLVGYTDINHKIEKTICDELSQDEYSIVHKYRLLTHKQKLTINMILDDYTEKK